DVAAVAKRDLRAGEMLDGEGGYTVWGKLMPATASLKAGALPIGLAHRLKLRQDVAHGALVRWSDVEIDMDNETVRTRRAMETRFGAARCPARPPFSQLRNARAPLIRADRLVMLATRPEHNRYQSTSAVGETKSDSQDRCPSSSNRPKWRGNV